MASSDDIGSFETWAFRSPCENSWFSEEDFVRDTDAVTKALTYVSGSENVSFSETPTFLPVQNNVSSSGGSDPELNIEVETTSVSKRPKRNVLTRKITKRKTRATKRSTTTFITADPANFRQMVQQVTGVQFGPGSVPILKPDPYRVGFGSGLVSRLPTLDTSAFLMDHHHQQVRVGGPVDVGNGPSVGPSGGSGFDFDGFSCFPTLESWKVM